MTIHIAHFTSKHRIIQVEQNSVFTWKQESGEVDIPLLQDKINRESAIHFYRMIAPENYDIALKDITVSIVKTAPFSG